MKNTVFTQLCIGATALIISQTGSAGIHAAPAAALSDVSSHPQAVIIAAGPGTRIERRHDMRNNSRDRVDDKQDFREERRDCTGGGADCRSDNRQDKRSDTVDRAQERGDDRRDRRF
jgi:hypothetical protein